MSFHLCLDGVINLLRAATYLIGVAFICFLPPWEGYDEMAHYSYAQQLADTGQQPTLEAGRLSMDVEIYRKLGPTPYSTTQPFDQNGAFTYRRWFALDEVPKLLVHERPSVKRHFAGGDTPNWQAQHPPLYYWLIAPVVDATADLSWAAQLFSLRLLSWTLAFAGMLISISSTARALGGASEGLRKAHARIALAWPLLFPGFFPEFARMGNDSLVLFLMSLAWSMLMRCLSGSPRLYWYLVLGLVLGLGGLTKITFLPIFAAVIGWLLWIGLSISNRREQVRNWIGTTLVAIGYFFLTWKGYLDNVTQRGSISGLGELSANENLGFLFSLSALQHPFEVTKGILGMSMTFLWGGSASSAYPPVVSILPVLLLTGGIFLCSVSLLKGETRNLAVLSILVVVSVVSGLFYYLLVRIAVFGVGAGAPGWYLHTLMAPLSLLLAGGWYFVQQRIPFALGVWRGWLAYMLIFGTCVAWLQLTLFSACSFKAAERLSYSFDDPMCIVDFPAIYQRLDFLTYPMAGIALSVGAVLLYTRVIWLLCHGIPDTM